MSELRFEGTNGARIDIGHGTDCVVITVEQSATRVMVTFNAADAKLFALALGDQASYATVSGDE